MIRPVKIAILACIGIVLAFGAAAVYLKQNYSASFSKETNNNLSAEQRQDYENQLKEVEGALDQARNDEEKYALYIRQGELLHTLGRLSDAKKSYERAVDLKQDDYIARWGIHQVQVDAGDKKGALQTVKMILIKHPELTEVWLKYISLQKELNPDKDNMNGVFAEALSKTGSHITVIKLYAQWLEESGDLFMAREYWQQAIDRDTANRTAYTVEIRRLDALLQKQQ